MREKILVATASVGIASNLNHKLANPSRVLGVASLLAIIALISTTPAQAEVLAHVAYVANASPDGVAVLDTVTNTVATKKVNVGGHSYAIAITPNGAYAYVAVQGPNARVAVINTATNTVDATIAVSATPQAIAITPDGAHIYVANRDSGNVSVIDAATNTVTATVTVGNLPYGLAITPNGAYAYVVNLGSNNVSVIDTATNTVTATVLVGVRPEDVAITPNGAYAYVAVQGSNKVSVIDTATNTVTATVAVGDAPESIAITPDGSRAYVVNHNAVPATVSVIDTATNTVMATVVVGTQQSLGVAITPNGAYAYVTIQPDRNLSVIDTVTNTVSTTVSVGYGSWPVAIAITPIAIDIDTDDDEIPLYLDNCPTVANPDQADTNDDGVGDACDELTPQGFGISVSPVVMLPGGVDTTTVELTFDRVVAGGTTNVTAASTPSEDTTESPTGFEFGIPPVYYDVSTTAQFTGSVAVCFSWAEGQFTDENGIELFHFENGAWTIVTTSLNTTLNIVCGEVSNLSPFALFESSFAGFFAPVDNPPIRNVVKAGAAVPVKFSLGGNQGLSIFQLGYPAAQSVACESGTPSDLIEETVTAGGSNLSYDASSDRYSYVWKTNKAWAKSCRRLILKLSSGLQETADFEFVK